MNSARTTQTTIIQGNHSAGDALPLGKNVLTYTVKCHPMSSANLFVGINEDASEGNLLQPGESMTIPTIENFFLDDQVYVSFDGSSGRALLIVTRSLETEYCK